MFSGMVLQALGLVTGTLLIQGVNLLQSEIIFIAILHIILFMSLQIRHY